MNPRHALCLATVLIALVIAARAVAQSETKASDARAIVIADEMLAALGGQEAWDATRFLHFGFAGRREHWWDKHSGRYRLEGATKENEPYVVLMDLDTKQGRAWLSGQEASGEKLDELLKSAWGAWVNDTYWLLMPYKLRDPGVTLADAGEETVDGVVYDKVQLSFANVGLTPGDRYWAYVNRSTHLMDRWAYILESMDPQGPPTVWEWQGWTRHGKILLAPERRQVGAEQRTLSLQPVEVPAALPDAVFTDPKPLRKP
jgi:hypothetical protein